MPGRARYRRSQRLGNRDVSRVLGTGRRIRIEPLLVHVCSNGLSWARLAIVVPKRHVPRAVDRNRARREFREWFRLNQDKLVGRDLLVRFSGRPDPGQRPSACAERLLEAIR